MNTSDTIGTATSTSDVPLSQCIFSDKLRQSGMCFSSSSTTSNLSSSPCATRAFFLCLKSMTFVSPDNCVLCSVKNSSAVTNTTPNPTRMPKFFSNVSHYEHKCSRRVITYPPDMVVRIVVRQCDKTVAIHGALARYRAHSPANLVRERHVFISSTTRYIG